MSSDSSSTPASEILIFGLANMPFHDLASVTPGVKALMEKVDLLDPEIEPQANLRDQVYLLIRLVQKTLQGEYRDTSVLLFAHALVAIDYFARELDHRPDYQPGGYLDDQQVVDRVFERFGAEIHQFVAWRQARIG